MVSPVKSAVALLSVFLVFQARLCVGGINFSPALRTEDSEGVATTYLIFKNGGREISYTPPTGWTYSGSAESFTMYSAGLNPATAVIEALPAGGAWVFNETGFKRVVEECMTRAPKGSDHFRLVSREQSVLKIGGHDGMEATAGFSLYGRPMQMSLLVLNWGAQNLSVRLVCDRSEFTRMHDLLLASLINTWCER